MGVGRCAWGNNVSDCMLLSDHLEHTIPQVVFLISSSLSADVLFFLRRSYESERGARERAHSPRKKNTHSPPPCVRSHVLWLIIFVHVLDDLLRKQNICGQTTFQPIVLLLHSIYLNKCRRAYKIFCTLKWSAYSRAVLI